MLEKLQGILDRFTEIEQQLAEVGNDYTAAIELSKERAELEPLNQKALAYKETLEKIEETKHLAREKMLDKLFEKEAAIEPTQADTQTVVG